MTEFQFIKCQECGNEIYQDDLIYVHKNKPYCSAECLVLVMKIEDKIVDDLLVKKLGSKVYNMEVEFELGDDYIDSVDDIPNTTHNYHQQLISDISDTMLELSASEKKYSAILYEVEEDDVATDFKLHFDPDKDYKTNIRSSIDRVFNLVV